MVLEQGTESSHSVNDNTTDMTVAIPAAHCSFRSCFRWKPTSENALAMAEHKMLQYFGRGLRSKFVLINNGTDKIRTISMNTSSNNTPVVMLHGMGSGIGLWALNFKEIAKTRPVYAIDLLGFGRSSRIKFPSEPSLTEAAWVESIESWRQEMGLDQEFILMGHSLGGYLASSYSLRFPKFVKHLVLADPWGFMEQPSHDEYQQKYSAVLRGLVSIVSMFNPLSILRGAGPAGPWMVRRSRPDIYRNFAPTYSTETVSQYIYHCNAQRPSGETAFKNISESFGWAKTPMVRRVTDMDIDLPITFIFGARSWIDSSVGYEVKYMRSNSYVKVHSIRGAGHHVYADQAGVFNETLLSLCKQVDEGELMETDTEASY